tara:strand:+ start:2341 stop:3723 length:1383 start_codon:yes stop_codon:yes gene_type:complete
MNYRQKSLNKTKHILTFSTNENPNIKNNKYKRVVYVMNNFIETLNKRLTDMLGIECIGRCKEKNTNEKFMSDLSMRKILNNLPEFQQNNPFYSFDCYIDHNEEDIKKFQECFEIETENLYTTKNELMKTFYYKNIKCEKLNNRKYYDLDRSLTEPIYPIYVISYSRFNTRPLTSETLCDMKQKHYLVVEKKQYDNYIQYVNTYTTILVMSDKYDDIKYGRNGEEAVMSSTCVRNFVWEHSRKNGDKRHWILDDNIKRFVRWNRMNHIDCVSPICFRSCEIITDRMKDCLMSGLSYKSMCPAIDTNHTPVILNTHVYSCILLSNEPNEECYWRGRYNEDADLSIRILKTGKPTIKLNMFLCDKAQTNSCKGGNEEIYSNGLVSSFEEGMIKKYNYIYNLHPQYIGNRPLLHNKHHHDIKVCGELGGLELKLNYIEYKKNIYEMFEYFGSDFITNEYGLILK